MYKLPIFLVFLFFSMINLASAETCNAGHGCKITCKDGCGAIYWPETKKCSKFCAESAKTQMTNEEVRINGNFHDMPKEQIIKTLESLSK